MFIDPSIDRSIRIFISHSFIIVVVVHCGGGGGGGGGGAWLPLSQIKMRHYTQASSPHSKFDKLVPLLVNDIFYTKTLQTELGMCNEAARKPVALADVKAWTPIDTRLTTVDKKLAALCDWRGIKARPVLPWRLMAHVYVHA